MKPKRNDTCPCGSGKKYKHCCLKEDEKRAADMIEDDKDVKKYKLRSLIGASSFILNPAFEVEVIAQTTYKGSSINVFHYASMFQYIFEFNGDIYQDHFFYKPKIRKRFLAFFGFPMYTDEEMAYGEQVMLSAAMDSIDALLTPVPYKTPANVKVPTNK